MIGNKRHPSGREKLAAIEQQQDLFRAAGDRCVVCGACLNSGQPQLGHVFGQGVRMMAKHGPEVIHHPLAMVPTDSLRCNAAVMMGDETEPGRALLARIHRIILNLEPMPSMADHYEALREEFAASRKA